MTAAGAPNHAAGADSSTDSGMRKIIHIDMDCFFAAVEMRDNPALREVPLAIGGSADRRGVISTCNYVARRFGVRSAMPSALARKLCPPLVLLPPQWGLSVTSR